MALMKSFARKRPNGLKHVQAKILTGESHGNVKCSSRFPEKAEWEAAEHLAYCVYNVKHDNLQSSLQWAQFFGRRDGQDNLAIKGMPDTGARP
ncbi:hypothetical protein EYZ11_002458 [Aspergillus tanneri]|uniref:Uncharacterized protein n=1 Tax=Aspergillus tanneri TaxID=1220188 RepID=A0A4S3JQS6_9EURO|nr:hypothetical protein EYZ11_002458 [Aspergillus tanneri]